MRELEGLSYSEIGERLGMSRAVVESTLFRARKRLTEEYEELVSGRRCERVREVVAAERVRSLEALGIRERRRLARHLSHCQPCRRHAHMSGFDDSVLETPGLVGRIAALLPIPWLKARLEGRDGEVVTASGAHSMAIAPRFRAPHGWSRRSLRRSAPGGWRPPQRCWRSPAPAED